MAKFAVAGPTGIIVTLSTTDALELKKLNESNTDPAVMS